MTKKISRSFWKREAAVIAGFTFIIPLLAIGILVHSIDTALVRDKAAEVISSKIGRDIALEGPVKWSFSPSHGFSLSLSDIAINNPSWASRPRMAQIGQADLHVAFWPLLRREVYINAFDLDNVDMMIETHADGAANWALKQPQAEKKKAEDDKSIASEAGGDAAAAGADVSINIKRIGIRNSRFGIRDKAGEVKIFDVPSLDFYAEGTQVRLEFKGALVNIPADVSLVGGPLDQITGPKWPFNAQIILGDIKLDAIGRLEEKASRVVLEKYLFQAKTSKVEGDLVIALGGARPDIKGTVNSAALDPAHFTLPAMAQQKDMASASTATNGAPSQTTAAVPSNRVFSETPYDFSALETVDLSLDILIESMPVGAVSLSAIKTSASLSNGKLILPALTGKISDNLFRGSLLLDSKKVMPDLSFVFAAKDMDMSSFIKMGRLSSIIEGKADIDIKIDTRGRSPRDFASFANGHINMLMAGGTIATGTLQSIAGSLVNVFMPAMSGVMDSGVNCLAARYTLTQGLLETKGLLIDTPATTISGSGFANLADERVNMELHTRPKGAGLTALIPSMAIQGALASPRFAMDANNAMTRVTGLLRGQSLGSGVPDLVYIEGQNTCAATLDYPHLATKQTEIQPVLTPAAHENLSDKVNTLMRGLGGNLFGK